MEGEIDLVRDTLQGNEEAILKKIDREEVTKIWAYFQRFAEYKDLKKLHTIVIPEIAKFE